MVWLLFVWCLVRNLINDRYSDLQNVSGGDNIFAAAIIPAMGVIVAYFVITNQISVEEREVKTDAAAKAGLERYVRLTANNAASVDNRLVFLVDVMTIDQPIVDPQLGLELKAIKAVRKVESYQPGRNTQKVGSSKKGPLKRFVGAVEKDLSRSANGSSQSDAANRGWLPGQLPASRLVAVRGRVGGAVGEATFLSDSASMIGLKLSPQLVASASTHIVLSPEQIEGVDALKNVIKGPVHVGSEYIFFGAAPQAPHPGDVRIHYEVAPIGTYSVMAQKKDDVLDLRRTSDGQALSFVRHGPVVLVEISNLVDEGHEFNIYSQRGIAIVIFFISLMMILVPLGRLSSMSPLLREVIDLFNPFMTFAVSTFAISAVVFCSWITYRADLAIATLVFGCAFMVLATWISRLMRGMRR